MKPTSEEGAGLGGGSADLTPEQLDDSDSRVGAGLQTGDESWDDSVLVWNGMVAAPTRRRGAERPLSEP